MCVTCFDIDFDIARLPLAASEGRGWEGHEYARAQVRVSRLYNTNDWVGMYAVHGLLTGWCAGAGPH